MRGRATARHERMRPASVPERTQPFPASGPASALSSEAPRHRPVGNAPVRKRAVAQVSPALNQISLVLPEKSVFASDSMILIAITALIEVDRMDL